MKTLYPFLLLLFISNQAISQDIYGCTDQDACNYNSLAIIDDGSCLYFDACCFCGDETQISNGSVGNEMNSIWLEDNGNGTYNVNYNTDTEIAGFQFQVEGTNLISAYGGEGHFSTFFSDSTGIVVSFSFTGELISVSPGYLITIELEGPPSGLSNIVVSGAGGTNLEFVYDSGLDCTPIEEECFPQQTLQQTIKIDSGWNIFSSYIVAENMNISEIFSEFEEVVIIKDAFGDAYLPSWDFNAIGSMELGQAYQIKVNEDIDVILDGLYFQPENSPIIINEGWNLLGYLRLEPINLELLFTEPILSEIVIIKNSEGLAFLPEFDYNGIGEFEAGKGYQIKVNSEQTFYYLEN